MDKQNLPKSLAMPQRIYDRAFDELRLLKLSLKTRADDGFNDAFRCDVFRKHDLFLGAYANLCREKNAAKILFDTTDPQFTGLNNWAKTILKGFIPDDIHGIKQVENPQVPILKTKVPLDIRSAFDNAVINAQIKKAFVDTKLAGDGFDKIQIQDARNDILRIKDQLAKSFDSINELDQGHWSNLKEVSDDFIEALKILGSSIESLKDAENDTFNLVP